MNNIEYVNTGSVKPYDKNPRRNDDSVEFVANSIKEFGFQQPIVVDKDMVVIAGHTRLKAAKKLNLKEVQTNKQKPIGLRITRFRNRLNGTLSCWTMS